MPGSRLRAGAAPITLWQEQRVAFNPLTVPGVTFLDERWQHRIPPPARTWPLRGAGRAARCALALLVNIAA